MNDQILIRGLQLSCLIGVPAEERAERQNLRAHLTLEVGAFSKDDRIDGTVDYKEVSDSVRQLAAAGERHLLETLAQEIAAFILEHYPVRQVRVELEKFILPETDWVGVVVSRPSLNRD